MRRNAAVTELTAISANGQQVSHEFSWQILRRPLDLTPNIFFAFFSLLETVSPSSSNLRKCTLLVENIIVAGNCRIAQRC